MDAHRHPDPKQGGLLSCPPYPHPSKEEVRAYMERRKRTRLPPPTPAEIRRQLGWHSGAQANVATAVPAPAAWGWLPAMLPAVLTELAAATLLAWYTAFVPRPVLSEKNDRKIT